MKIVFLILVVVVGYVIYRAFNKKKKPYVLTKKARQLLQEHVGFYRELSAENKNAFENRVADFLSGVAITGVGVEVEELDRILIAAGAIIPIFSFPTWRYNNISEVLLYNDTFSRDYRTIGDERNVLGMVGDGAMHRQMILSKPSVRASFANDRDARNTVIHEFTHLLDKADGATDGIPEYLLDKPYIMPWVKKMHETISEMKSTGQSDINLYGATNEAEFFAVVSEYFFERPEELQEKHPELYKMLERMFQTEGTLPK